MSMITIAMIEDAAKRALANGFDLRNYTPHYVARDLISYDADFERADYTLLVSKVRQWQKGLR